MMAGRPVRKCGRMKYYRYLYWGAGLEKKGEKKKEKVIRRLEQGKFQMDVYVLALAGNERNHLEIYQSALFLQPDFPYENFFVVGIAKGYEDAMELVEEIVKEVYNETEGADIRSYILKKEQEG